MALVDAAVKFDVHLGVYQPLASVCVHRLLADAGGSFTLARA